MKTKHERLTDEIAMLKANISYLDELFAWVDRHGHAATQADLLELKAEVERIQAMEWAFGTQWADCEIQ